MELEAEFPASGTTDYISPCCVRIFSFSGGGSTRPNSVGALPDQKAQYIYIMPGKRPDPSPLVCLQDKTARNGFIFFSFLS